MTEVEKMAKWPRDLHYYCDDVRCGANKFYEQGYLAGHANREAEVLTLKADVQPLLEALQFVIEREDYSFAECSVAEVLWSKCKQALESYNAKYAKEK